MVWSSSFSACFLYSSDSGCAGVSFDGVNYGCNIDIFSDGSVTVQHAGIEVVLSANLLPVMWLTLN